MTGGYEGAMGAASRGARQEGGRVIGVTTPIFPERTANDALDAEWSEPDYLARMSTLLRQGDAFVGLPGGLGTLSEWLAAVCLASIGQLDGPVILFRDPWEPVFTEVLRLPEVVSEASKFVRFVNNVEGVIEALERG
jgi:predicted Rossmann-fold nucleotide-binding protein